MTTIETKIAKNGALILKVNGKRESYSEVMRSMNRFSDCIVGTVIKAGEKTFTSTSNNHPAPSAKCAFSVGFAFTDENGNKYFFGTVEAAINRIARNEFTDLNILPAETTEVDADEYAITAEALYTAVRAEMYNANRAAGNYTVKIGDETVEFQNFKVVRVDSPKRELNFRLVNGRKMFYYYGDVIPRKKIAEMYMENEQAAAQGKILADFYKAIPDTGKIFEVYCTATFADGREHSFIRTFDNFTQAEKLADEFKKFAADKSLSHSVRIQRREAFGHIFYHFNSEGISEGYARHLGIEHVHGNEFRNLNEKVAADKDDTDVFSLLPDVDELNDVDDEAETEINEPEPESPEPATTAEEPATEITEPSGYIFTKKLVRELSEPQKSEPPETEPDAEAFTLVTELAEALEGVYVEDWSETPVDGEPKIIPAADMRELLDGLPATDESLTAYRKNPDGTFTEDRHAYERLKAAETAILDATTDWNQMRELERETLSAYTPETSEGDNKIVEHLNANAPEGWTVERAEDKLAVKFNGKPVTETDRLTNRDLLAPHSFFQQFQPLADKSKTPRQMFLDDRYRELEELNSMRDECLKLPNFTVGQLQTLDAMIERLKRDIAEAEFDERDTVLKFCESGSAIDADGNIWF